VTLSRNPLCPSNFSSIRTSWQIPHCPHCANGYLRIWELYAWKENILLKVSQAWRGSRKTRKMSTHKYHCSHVQTRQADKFVINTVDSNRKRRARISKAKYHRYKAGHSALRRRYTTRKKGANGDQSQVYHLRRNGNSSDGLSGTPRTIHADDD